MKTPPEIFRETIVEVIRNIARLAEQMPSGTLHYTSLDRIADDMAKNMDQTVVGTVKP